MSCPYQLDLVPLLPQEPKTLEKVTRENQRRIEQWALDLCRNLTVQSAELEEAAGAIDLTGLASKNYVDHNFPNTTTWTYGGNGQVSKMVRTFDGEIWSFLYDAQDRLSRIVKALASMTQLFTYVGITEQLSTIQTLPTSEAPDAT